MEILHNISLKDYNTFHLDVLADSFAHIESADDVRELYKQWLFASQFLVLGGWSNVLLLGDYHGLVVHNAIVWINIFSEDDDTVTVRVWAGEQWRDFVNWAVSHNYGGVENLAYIPGTVWAAPVQNIGAYGVEARSTVDKVFYVDVSTGEECVLTNEECRFWYRDSIFKQALKWQAIITMVQFVLQKVWPNYNLLLEYKDIKKYIAEHNLDVATLGVADLASIITEVRKAKLPDWNVLGTAWSFFKNPVVDPDFYDELVQRYPEVQWYVTEEGVKLSAWQLIDMVGLKGIDRGVVGTYQNHALVLIHNGGGTGQDVAALATFIQEQVREQFGVRLEPEVQYILSA
jgi:UDP-N-acetylmuramate dehydrogenase